MPNANLENDTFFLNLVLSDAISVLKTGTVINNITGREIGLHKVKRRYKKISMLDKETNKIKHIQVHRLVYLVYKGPIPEGYEINHIDGRTDNNSESNLEALTKSGNMKHAVKTGLAIGFSKGNKFQALRKSFGNRFGTFRKAT